ncbi:MAG: DUF1858 domain-containing protein [Firmicutes bacterium]|nr:DUF1858 domain-containing protein [Bacillota bacterium]
MDKVNPDTNVGRLLQEHPELLDVFLKHGFAPLKNPVFREQLAKLVKIGTAARMHRVNLEALLRDLNRVLERG